MKNILIIDDDVAVTNYLKVFLMQSDRFKPTVENDSRKVADMLEEGAFDLILLDMDMPVISGMDILNIMTEKNVDIPVVVLTGVSDVDLAVKAMKQGAFDYLIKPADDDKLLKVLESALEHSVLRRSINQLPDSLSRDGLTHEAAFTHLPTQDAGMIRLFHQAEKIASSDLSIFIWGESGTGKEGLARAIHEASPRRGGPFVALDADGEDPDKFPAFFFGQAKDWSGQIEETNGLLEEADYGTLFLNNIDALPMNIQVRLKRVIQRGEYYRESSARVRNIDVRMIVSSKHDLSGPVYRERFHQDFLFHLMINSIRMPALRERPGDIPLLARYFLEDEVKKTGKKISGFSDDFMEVLKEYCFPDNVRELKTIIASVAARTETDMITVDALPSFVMERRGVPAGAANGDFTGRRLDEVVKEHVIKTLEECGGDAAKAARILGVPEEELERF